MLSIGAPSLVDFTVNQCIVAFHWLIMAWVRSLCRPMKPSITARFVCFVHPPPLPGLSTRQFQLLRFENIRELLSEEHVDMKELVIYPFIPTYLEL